MTTTLNPPTRPALDLGVVRPLLALDAVGCLLLGAVGVLASSELDGPLGASRALLVVAGVVLLAYGAEAALVVRRPSRTGLLALAIVNAGFAIGCVLTLVEGSLSGRGTVVAVALTAVSAVMADVLLLGARRRS
jgi:hypothetical protein